VSSSRWHIRSNQPGGPHSIFGIREINKGGIPDDTREGAAMPFVKIWTTVKQDAWFLGLSCLERGVWLQFMIEAKEGEKCGKIGTFFQHSCATLASNLGCDARTVRKVAAKMQADGKIIYTENENGTLTIEIVNYQYWQDLKRDRDNNKTQEHHTKMRHKCGINPPDREENEIEIEIPPAPENPTVQKPTPPKPGHTLSDIGIMLKAIGYMARRSPKLETDLAVNVGNLRKRLEDWSDSAGGMRWTMFKIGCYYEQFFAKDTNGADPLEDIRLPMNYLYTLIFPDHDKGQQTGMESPSGIAFRDEYTVDYWAQTFMPEMFK
jgi:hypothetical protein